MTAAKMPRDMFDAPIPALSLKSGGAHQINATSSAARNSTAFGETTPVVGFYADVPVFVSFGDSSVTATATDHYFPAGIYYDFSLYGATHVSVLAADTDGTVYISEKR